MNIDTNTNKSLSEKNIKLRPLVAAVGGILLATFAGSALASPAPVAVAVIQQSSTETVPTKNDSPIVAATFKNDFSQLVGTNAPSTTTNFAAIVNVGAVRVGGIASAAITLENNGLLLNGKSATLTALLDQTVGTAVVNSSVVTNLARLASDNTNLKVGINTTQSGTIKEFAKLDLSSSYAGTTTSLNADFIEVTGKVYEAASASITPSTIDFGNVRVNDAVASKTITIENVATGALVDNLVGGVVAGKGTNDSSNFGINNGGFNLGSLNSSNTDINFNTASSGSFTNVANVLLNSHNDVMGSNKDLTLSTQHVTITGAAYQTAAASVTTPSLDFGSYHVNETVADKNITVTNTATGAKGYVDSIVGNASTTSSTFNVTSDKLNVGTLSSQNLAVNFNTSKAGGFSDNATVNLASHDNVITKDVGLASQNVNLSGAVYNYAAATLTGNGVNSTLIGSNASIAPSHTITLDFGSFVQNSGNVIENFSLGNTGGANVAFTDILKAEITKDFSLGHFSTTDFTNMAAIKAGSSADFGLSFNTSQTGNFNDKIFLTMSGSNSSGYQGAVGTYEIDVKGMVTAVPEADEWAMMLVGLGLVGVQLSRKNNKSLQIFS